MKTVCVYHRIDLDGWMSAAIVKHWFKQNNIKRTFTIGDINSKVVEGILDAKLTEHYGINSLMFIGYHYGDPIPDLSKCDQVIMVDISFPKEIMLELANKYDVRFRWIDHHQPKINEIIKYLVENKAPTIDGLTTIEGRPKFAACELTWKHLFPNETIPEIVRLLGRYDCFGHKGTDEEQKVLEFQYGARQRISNYKDAYNYLLQSFKGVIEYDYICPYNIEAIIQQEGESIYKYLCTEAKQTYKTGFTIELTYPIENLKSDNNSIGKYNNPFKVQIIPFKFIAINRERFNPVNFGIDYHKDGYDGVLSFYFDGKVYQCSVYNDNGQVDCAKLAKQFEGGGHKGAAGFRLTVEQFNNLINGA